MELSSPKLKKLVLFLKKNYYISGGNLQSPKTTLRKFLILFQKKFSPHFGVTADEVVK